MSLVIKLTLIATLIMGFGMPLLKISQRLGVNASEILIFNGIACLIIGISTLFIFNHPTSGFYWKGILTGLFTTLFLNVGFYIINYSFSLGGDVSVVYAITPAATLITVFIGLFFLGEAKDVIIGRLLVGVFGLLGSLYLITTSIKN